MKIRISKIAFFTLVINGILCISVSANNLLHQADSLYVHQNYNEALHRYRILLNSDKFLKEDFTINFKMGICYLRNRDYDEAETIFRDLKFKSNKIPEYIDFNLFLSSFHKDKPWLVITKARRFLSDYKDHFLADSVLLRLADYEYKLARFEGAYKDYARLSGKKKMRWLKPYFLSQMALCQWYLNKKNDALERMYQVLKKYPSDPAALKIADLFQSYSTPSAKYEFAIAVVYLKHRQFDKLTNRLEKFIQITRDLGHKERARYYLVQIYYEKQKYQIALYGFKNLLSSLKDKSLESRLRISIARCYLYLGQKIQAVNAYIDYAGRYPRRRLAVESIWKAGWIYEELGMISKELSVYQQLLKRWPRCKYRHEAKFRIGLSYLRLGQLRKAERSFEDIGKANLSEFHKTRSMFWLAKLYQMQGKQEESAKISISLGSELFKSYYTLKSYLHYEQQIDSLYYFKDRLSDTKNPLRFHKNSLVNLMEKFEELFLIRELLGQDIALKELSEKKYYPGTLKGWISLAEIYKKLGAYNQAFRIYDYIDNKHFSDLTDPEKPFLLKESYPLYYDKIIGDYGITRNLDKNLVLALIRAESSFDRKAHSWANAYGLMQIIPRTAKSIASEIDAQYKIPEDLFDPELNINLGTYYLKRLLNQFDENPEFAIAAYNAGPHRVQRWQKFKYSKDIDFFVENIEYTQTRNYVRRVLRNYWIYSLLDEVN